MKETVLITGGTGLIGNSLSSFLVENGFEVTHLSRGGGGNGSFKTYKWDLAKGSIDDEAIKTADYIIHLAGANVFDHKWTKEVKKEIHDSRTRSAQLLVECLKTLPNKVKAFISASAIGYYGADSGDFLLNEDSPAGDDFIAEVVKDWEAAVSKAEALGIRTVMVRTGIVLTKAGGALEKILGPVQKGMGGAIGTGKQYISWIHIEDLCRIYLKAIKDLNIKGIFNAVSPYPVTNAEMVKEVATAIHKPALMPNIPAFMVKMALGGERAEMVLGGNRVSGEKIIKAGYDFRYPTLPAALKSLL